MVDTKCVISYNPDNSQTTLNKWLYLLCTTLLLKRVHDNPHNINANKTISSWVCKTILTISVQTKVWLERLPGLPVMIVGLSAWCILASKFSNQQEILRIYFSREGVQLILLLQKEDVDPVLDPLLWNLLWWLCNQCYWLTNPLLASWKLFEKPRLCPPLYTPCAEHSKHSFQVAAALSAFMMLFSNDVPCQITLRFEKPTFKLWQQTYAIIRWVQRCTLRDAWKLLSRTQDWPAVSRKSTEQNWPCSISSKLVHGSF